MRAPRLGELALAGACALSCRPEPARPIVDEVRLEGLSAVDEQPLLDGLATTETPRLFGFSGILEYATYDPHVLSRDLLRIERYLRARGYYDAKVTAARVVRLGDNRVRVEIRVHEGQPVRVSRLLPDVASLPPDAVIPANQARKMRDGDIFDEDRFELDKRNIERTLRDLGYAFATVRATARVDVAQRTAEITYDIEAGPKSRYGPITFVGLREIPEGPVRDNLQIREGDPYSETELEEARTVLVNLGVFSTVEIVPDRSRPETGIVPIQVRVRESALRTVRVGGGVQLDVLRLLTRLQTSWEHRNFLGGMRRFRVSAEPGLTLFPTRIEHLTPPTRLLPENRVSAELKQPSFLEGRTTGTLSLEYSVAPRLYPLLDDVEPEDEIILGYHEVLARAGVERWLASHHVFINPAYNWQANVPFTYQGDKHPGLEFVRVSFPQLVTTLDFRKGGLRTRSGVYLSNTLEVAGHIFGGTVSDVRIRPEARLFFPIDASVLGLRLTFGFLFPHNYGESLQERSRDPTAPFDPSAPDVVRDQQILNLRAFYSGGPNSNRGYPYRTVGPHGAIGFLAPSTDPECRNFAATDACMRPQGGLTLWEASVEARIPLPIDTPLDAVLFVDASDLTREVGQIRLNVPHLSPGFGLRYWTPVGPLRLDVGWRPPTLQHIGKDRLEPDEGRPGDDLFGLFPGAIHLVFGSEAF